MAPSYGVLENRTIVDGQASKRIDATSSQYHGLIHPQDLRWTFSLKPGKVDPAIVTEGRSHYFTTEKGEFIFFQIVYANIAIKPSFQVSVRYYAPASDHDIQGINLFYSDNLK